MIVQAGFFGAFQTVAFTGVFGCVRVAVVRMAVVRMIVVRVAVAWEVFDCHCE